MARTTVEVTQSEIGAYAKFAKERGIIHDGSADDHHNANFVLDYFVDKWKEMMTEQNLNYAWERIHSHLKLYSPAQAEWYKNAEHNPQLANDIAAYLASTSGLPGALVRDGSDLHFENLLVLFKEINGRGESATAQSLMNAQDRIQRQPGKGRLHFVPQPRKEMGAITEAARNDGANTADWHAGKSFLGADMVPDGRGGLRSKTPAEQKREREAAEKAAQPTVREQKSADDQRWDSMSQELLSYGTHGQQETLRKIYESTGNSRARFEALNRTVKMYKRSAQMSGWAGR